MKASNFIFAAILMVAVAAAITAQTSAFTYQGRFTDGGTAANGTYEMQFMLFDGASNQIGATVTNAAVVVSDGVFTVQLDYGSAAFSGADRFLEIGVRPAGNGNSFTILSPRQQLTSAVYAIRAGSTTTADNATKLGGVAAGQYVQSGDSRLTNARPPTSGSSNYIQNTNNQQAANFNISGYGEAGRLDAKTEYDLNGGRFISSAGFTNSFVGYGAGNLDSPGNSNSFFGANAGRLNTANQNSFFGYEAGTSNTTGDANAFFGYSAGYHNTIGEGNAFFGSQAGDANTAGFKNAFFGAFAGVNNVNTGDNSFFGYTAGYESTGTRNSFFGKSAGATTKSGGENSFFGASTGASNTTGQFNTLVGYLADVGSANLINATAIGANARVDDINSLVLGSIAGVNGAGSDTKVGIGTTAPAFRLTVKTGTSSYGMVHTDGTVSVGTFVGGSTGGGWIGTRSNHSLSFFTNDGGAAMTLETSGFLKLNNVDAGGQLSLCLGATNRISFCSSSLRYKTALKDFTGGLNVVNRLRPLSFTWKDGGMRDLGFGAEEVAAVEPLLVTHNNKGEVEGVKYDRITAVLVNAVKEQQEQIRQQQTEIQMLKTLVCRRNRRAPVCK